MITWLEISNFEFSNINECIKRLKEKNCYVSPWIENICEKYNYKFVKIKKPKVLARVKVEDFGFKGPTELQAIYKKIENGILYMNKEPGLGLELSSDAVNKFGKKIN